MYTVFSGRVRINRPSPNYDHFGLNLTTSVILENDPTSTGLKAWQADKINANLSILVAETE